MKRKVGIGITTFERFDMFKNCFESLMANNKDSHPIVIVDDCSVKDRKLYDDYFHALNFNNVKIIVNEENIGVGKSKNIILEYFYDRDYDYIFTIEDDMLIKSPDVFDKYISVAEENEVEYLNFAHHGDYKDHPPEMILGDLVLHDHLTGAFSLHTKKLIDELGVYDEEYINAMEHVDYYYKASLKNLTTPFWYFADVKGSEDLINEQKNSIVKSAIRTKNDWEQNMLNARKLFVKKHGLDFMKIPRVR